MLGWPSELEDREFLSTPTAGFFSAPVGFVPPPTMSFRDRLKVWNQGDIGSCTGHGGAKGAGSILVMKIGSEIEMSRMYCYLIGQRMSNIRGDNGATITGCVKGLQNGICKEATFPYPNPVRYSNLIPASATNEAKLFHILGHQKLKSYQEVFDWISQGKGPVVFGFPWFDKVAETKGIVQDTDLQGPQAGGHCNLFTGYSGEKDAQGNYLIDDINSHGTSFGVRGWCSWTKKAIDRLAVLKDRKGNDLAEIIGITDISGFDESRVYIDFASLT